MKDHEFTILGILRGPGGGGSPTWERSKSSLTLFVIEGNPSYQMLFTRSKKMFLAKVINFWNFINACNYSTHANFKRDLPKLDFFLEFKNLSSPTYKFWNRLLKLGSYVFGVKIQIINPAKFLSRPLKSNSKY